MKRVLFMILLVIMLPVCFATSISYDANGNVQYDGSVYREYNGLNQLVAIHNGTSTSDPLLQTFSHHPLEERILVKKTYNVSDSSHVLESVYYFNKNSVRVVNSTGTYDFTFVYHNGDLVAQEVNGVRHYFHSDPASNIQKIVTDASGDVVENTSFSPFGSVLEGGTVSRYGYENKEFDSVIGDYDFHFRKYNPEWGIFLQPDNLLQNVYDPQALNRYAFERNNPLNNIDEDGHIFSNPIVFGAVLWLIRTLVPKAITKTVEEGGKLIITKIKEKWNEAKQKQEDFEENKPDVPSEIHAAGESADPVQQPRSTMNARNPKRNIPNSPLSRGTSGITPGGSLLPHLPIFQNPNIQLLPYYPSGGSLQPSIDSISSRSRGSFRSSDGKFTILLGGGRAGSLRCSSSCSVFKGTKAERDKALSGG